MRAFVPPPQRGIDRVLGRTVDVAPSIDPNKNPRLKAAFSTLTAQELIDYTEELMNNIESKLSKSTIEKGQRVMHVWSMMLDVLDPTLPEGRHWDADTIMRYYSFFLPAVLKACKPRSKNAATIKAQTLHEYMVTFTWAVAKHAREHDTALKAGRRLLVQENLITTMEDHLHTIINREKLDRFHDPRLIYGIWEVKLMIDQALLMSDKSGRAQAIQRICILLQAAFAASRPGTEGPSEARYARDGKFPKIGDLVVYQRKRLAYAVKDTKRCFKGNNNTVEGMERDFIFEPVQKWQNVPFDVGMWVVLLLLCRGAFEGIETLDDLRNCELLEIPIKESMKNEPLFLKLIAGGHGFVTPFQPMASRGISDVCQVMSFNAGLPKATAYAFRRGAANDFEVLMGKEAAEMILVHATTGSLYFYSRNTGNINIVGVRLNELHTPHDPDKLLIIKKDQMAGRAVQAAMVLMADVDKEKKKKIVARNEQTAKPRLPPDEKAKLLIDNPQLRALHDQKEAAYDAFFACYEPMLTYEGEPYKRDLRGLTAFKKKNPTLVAGMTAIEANQKHADAKKIVGKYNKLSKCIRRRGDREHGIGVNDERLVTRGTTDEAEAAAARLEAPSSFLTRIAEKVAKTVQVDEEDPSVAEEMNDLHTKLVNLFAPRRPNANVAASGSESTESQSDSPTGDLNNMTELESGNVPAEVANPLEVDACDVRSQYMEVILGPVFRQRALDNLFSQGKTESSCPICEALAAKYPDVQVKKFSSKFILDRHIMTQHTHWKHAILAMRVQGEMDAYQCPTATCAYRAITEAAVIKHCLGEDEDHPCAETEMYAALKADHHEQYHDVRDKRKEQNTSSILSSLRSQEQRQIEAVESAALSVAEEWKDEHTSAYETLSGYVKQFAKMVIEDRGEDDPTIVEEYEKSTEDSFERLKEKYKVAK